MHSLFWLRFISLFSLILLSCCVSSPESHSNTILIPEGWFLMGEDDGRHSNEPQRRVFLDTYRIDRTEVTQGNFAAFLTATGYDALHIDTNTLIEDPDLPVTRDLWEDAAAYCEWKSMRLPTEAEWEKASRGTNGRRFPWGEEWNPELANTVEFGAEGVLPVGSFPAGASPFGVLTLPGMLLNGWRMASHLTTTKLPLTTTRPGRQACWGMDCGAAPGLHHLNMRKPSSATPHTASGTTRGRGFGVRFQ